MAPKGTPPNSHPSILDRDEEATDPGLSPTVSNPGIVRPASPATAPRMPDLGPLRRLMQDPAVTEIMVNDVREIVVEKDGRLLNTSMRFTSLDELNQLVRNIQDFTGRYVTPESPYMDVTLPDGSRVNIVSPPVTPQGPCLTIRRFPKRLTVDHLFAQGTLDQKMGYFLNACVVGKRNILLCGGTGSGKTTFLNALAMYIPAQERIVTIEDTPELMIQHKNSVKMQTKAATPTAPGVTQRELVANALRMRPDRLILGECRRGEALDMLQAMNTGHEGSLTTVHANSPRDALARLETLCLLDGAEIPLTAVRKQIASAIEVIVQLKRYRNGRRRVTEIVELTGLETENYTLQEIFKFEPDPAAPLNPDTGIFKCTGFVPKFITDLKEQGIEIPEDFFI
ncbi:MAG: CpaF family protein [Bacteriovoracia bacterium]